MRIDSSPIHTIAAKGSSDLRMVLRPAGEKICPSLLAGLKRSNLNDRASGAKTKPPWARPTKSDTARAVRVIGNTQRIASRLVQKSSGPLGEMESEEASSSVVRKKWVQWGTDSRPMRKTTPATADIDNAPLSSRERVTCPRFLASCRCRGVACSVLLESAIVP